MNWTDYARDALEESGIEATEEQALMLSSWFEGAGETCMQAGGLDVVSKNWSDQQQDEMDGLKKALSEVKPRIECSKCYGKGYIWGGALRGSCKKCHGSGKVCRGY